MHYVALATDYDGTLAHDGAVDDPTIAALERARAGARRLILVTGRELPDLRRVLPRLDLFDAVVAENGAVLFLPEAKEERPLVPPPDPRFVERLRALGVNPLSVGRAIVATWEPNQTKVLKAIQELGLELTITFNKGAVMVLPAGINKATGLREALAELRLSPLNCVAVGDAENDMAFLDIAGAAAAVANAIPVLRERAALVMQGAHGAGVAELIDRVLATDLAEVDRRVRRQCVALARAEDGEELLVAPHRECLLLAGGSGGGKSTFTQGLIERLGQGGFQVCIIDPEGDYEGMVGAVAVGAADHPPDVEHVMNALEKPDASLVVNLLGVALADRPSFFGVLLPELTGLRARLGRPHFVVVDEAHHILPADWDPGGAVLPAELAGFLFVTTRPDALSTRLLCSVDRLLAVGAGAQQALETFCELGNVQAGTRPEDPETGAVVILDVADPTPRLMQIIPGRRARLRHQRKYAQGSLAEEKSFWFRGPDRKLNLRAQNLTLFVQMADGVDEATWQWHRVRGDYSRWLRDAIKDREMADEVAEIEAADAPAHEARRLVRDAIERRYTLPG